MLIGVSMLLHGATLLPRVLLLLLIGSATPLLIGAVCLAEMLPHC